MNGILLLTEDYLLKNNYLILEFKIMKTIEAVKAYKIMQKVKPHAMPGAEQIKYLQTMCALRAISEEYEKNVDEGAKALQDDKFEEMRQKGLMHNEAVQNKTNDGLLSNSELKEVNEYSNQYQKSVFEFINKLNEEDVNPAIEKLSKEAFTKLIESVELEGKDLETLYNVIV